LFLDLIFFIFKIYLSYLFVNFFLYSRSVVLVVSAHTNKKRFLGLFTLLGFFFFFFGRNTVRQIQEDNTCCCLCGNWPCAFLITVVYRQFQKIFAALGMFVSESEIQGLIASFLKNLSSNSVIHRRAASSCLLAIVTSSRKKEAVLPPLLHSVMGKGGFCLAPVEMLTFLGRVTSFLSLFCVRKCEAL